MPAISVVISNVMDIRKKEKKELLLHSMLHRYTSLHHHHHAATGQGDVSKLMMIKIGNVVSVFSHCSDTNGFLCPDPREEDSSQIPMVNEKSDILCNGTPTIIRRVE